MEWSKDLIGKELTIGVEYDLNNEDRKGHKFLVEGLYTDVFGHSYKDDVPASPEATIYSMRVADLPDDGMEAYGKLGQKGKETKYGYPTIFHISELKGGK